MLCLSLLIGCDSQPANTQTSRIATPTKQERTQFSAMTLYGLVNNDQHPIKNGRVEVVDSTGKTVATFQLQDNSKYTVDVPSTAVYPIVLTAYPDTGEAKDQPLRVVVVNPSPKYFDITALTTAIAEKALAMGGYTSDNLRKAALTSVAIPEKDRTMGGFSGDPTQQFGGWH